MDWFLIIYYVEVQAVLFAKYFLIYFPPGACCLHFREAIQPRRILYYAGGRLCRPPASPWTFTTKNVEKNGTKQISKHSTGCKNMKKRLGMNAIRATRFAAHILTKFNLSSLNSHFVLRQTAAWQCFISGFPDGRSPGERKADAGKPKGWQAECFEREGNPREP